MKFLNALYYFSIINLTFYNTFMILILLLKIHITTGGA